MSVYALHDPRTGRCRYVGASGRPTQRLRQHVSRPHSAPLRAWIFDLRAAGLAPHLSLLGRGSERHWIRKLRPDLNVNNCRPRHPITILVDVGQGALLDRAAGDIPVSTWTRSVALKAAREALVEKSR